MKRVLIIANKTWEVEPLLNALLNAEFKPKDLVVPVQLNYPARNSKIEYIPRATFLYAALNICFEIWCIQDLLTPTKTHSSSEEKYKSLPLAFHYKDGKQPELVIGFGTAGFLIPISGTTDDSNNGCVVIGSNVFLHDGHPKGNANPDSKLELPEKFELEIKSDIPSQFFDQIISSREYVKNVERRFLKPYLAPSKNIRIIINQSLIALSNINITNYNEYEIKDKEGIEAVISSGSINEIGSIETTHGIIRIISEAPFIFVSGITDRVGHFRDDVTPKSESQNYSCAFNAGIAVAWMIPEIIKLLETPIT